MASKFWRDCAVAFLVAGSGLGGALAQAQAPPPLAAWYARYLAGGRSDAEIHLASAGNHISARVRTQADGTVRCQVSGLSRATAGVLVHEVTHCLVGPYIAALDVGDDSAAQRLLQLTSESISDARAVIEVFRADGAAAAQALVAAMLPLRMNPSSASHATAAALQAALQLTRQAPETLATPSAAFAAAIAMGREAALQSLAQQPSRALDAALAQAQRAFDAGRYTNDAVTLHASNETMSAGDRHLFIEADGRIVERPTISAESAHGLEALQTMMAASQAPEHRLAVQWLLRQGMLEADSLTRVRSIFSRFLRSVGDGSAASVERVAQVLQGTIDEGPRGLDLSALLDEASDRVRSTPAAG